MSRFLTPLRRVCTNSLVARSSTSSRFATSCVASRLFAVRRINANSSTNVRRFSTQQDEEEEDRKPLPLSETRATLARSLADDLDGQSTEYDEWTSEYLAQSKFQVKLAAPSIDSDGVLATRTVDGHVVRVAFRANEYDTMQQQTNEQASEEDENAGEQTPPQAFTVDITNPSGKILRLELTNDATGELVFAEFGFPKSVKADPTLTIAPENNENVTPMAKESDCKLTAFDELTDESGDALIDYAESLGIDDDLALFVVNQAQLVRTMQLQRQLNKLKSFVQ